MAVPLHHCKPSIVYHKDKQTSGLFCKNFSQFFKPDGRYIVMKSLREPEENNKNLQVGTRERKKAGKITPPYLHDFFVEFDKQHY